MSSFMVTVALAGFCAVSVSPILMAGPDEANSNELSLWAVDTFQAQPDVAIPLYPSPTRVELSLDGEWQVKMDPDRVGFEEKWFADADLVYEDRQPVPGNWNANGLGGPGRIEQAEMLWPELGMRVTAEFAGSYHGLAWYRRTIDVPLSFDGQQVRLVFGAVFSSVRVWINGELVGGRWTDGNAFSFDATDQIRPGQTNIIVMAIDNHWDETATRSHLNWYAPLGGPYHHMVLRAVPKVRIESALVRPMLNGQSASGVANVHVMVRNQTQAGENVVVQAEVESLQDTSRRFGGDGRLIIGAGERGEIVIPIPIDVVEAWSLEVPNLYKLTIRAEAGTTTDTVVDRFGMRTVHTYSHRFFLNDEPVFITGQHLSCFWPNEMAPPIDKEDYAAIFKKMKAFGFNYLRTPWLMPEECYQAADEAGMMLQLEFPYAYAPHDQVKTELIERLIRECLVAYGNHPSLVTLCMSNEGSWDGKGGLNDRFCALSKSIDPTRLVIATDGIPEDQLSGAMISDVLSPTNHSNNWEVYMANVAAVKDEYWLRPTIDHEFLNVPTLHRPDVDAKYGGGIVKLPSQLTGASPAHLEEMGMMEEYDLYLQASYALQADFIKEGMARTRKNPVKAGYSMCAWQDIEAGIHWGILDAFMNEKGLSAEDLRTLNAPSVLLMDTIDRTTGQEQIVTDYCHRADQPIAIRPYVSHFGKAVVTDAALRWRLVSQYGDVLADGSYDGIQLVPYGVTKLAAIEVRPTDVEAPQRVTLEMELTDEALALKNQWPLWLFPAVGEDTTRRAIVADEDVLATVRRVAGGAVDASDATDAPADAVYITGEGGTARKWLSQGKNVLFLARSNMEINPFDPGWFKSDQHMGTIVREDAPLGDFPNDGYASWQFRYLIGRLTDGPVGKVTGRPIISSAFGDTFPSVQHQLFEARTSSGGRLTYCLLQVLSRRCEADYLLRVLLENAGPSEDVPVMSDEELSRYIGDNSEH